MKLDEFLSAPIGKIRPYAPETLVLGAGGTRRRAELMGKASSSAEYAQWTHSEMLACLQLIFRHGVQHIIAPLLLEGGYRETTAGYREELASWVEWGLGSSDAIDAFAEAGWNVRLLGSECWPELAELAARLPELTAHEDGPTVWFTVISQPELHWALALRRVAECSAESRADAVHAVYGQDIPAATLYLGSGKPDIVPSAVPPLLIGSMQCYWRQHLGFELDEETFRRVLYDYAFTRRTWQEDKSGRSQEVLKYGAAWDQPPVIGLGFRLGPFWYPSSFVLSTEVSVEQEKWE